MTTIVVSAAVVERDGHFLVTRRQAGVHLEGYWEFPGGKCRDGESHEQCLVREIREELDVLAIVDHELLTTVHRYLERTVELHFFRCTLEGAPTPQQGQAMRYVTRAELVALPFPPADQELVALLTSRPGDISWSS